MIAGFDLAAPLALLLLPLPLLFALWRQNAPLAAAGLRIPAAFPQNLAANPGLRAPSSRDLFLRWFAWLFLVLALAGPRKLAATPALPASGRDIMFALDLSGSMVAEDMVMGGKPITRIAALKKIGAELIRRRAGDRVGVVIFAENTLAAVPLSFDVESVSRSLDELTIGLVGRSTSMGVGLGLAVKRLADSKSPSRIIVLMSDGGNNAGTQDPAGVAVLARSLGMKVYTIGLGPNETNDPGDDPESVDFEALENYAKLGGGQAFRARTGEDLEAAGQAIEKQMAGEALAPPTIIRRDLWFYPAAAFLLACAGLVAVRRGRR
ncbi:MAG: VWA domain-containing protein [Beijerinckiaceae bacterium]|jgi:Ca-activated chloride channel family protein